MADEVSPWFPLDDIPRSPCGIAIEGAPERAVVRAVFSHHGGDRDLLIDFHAEVFGCFSELAAPPVNVPADYPGVEDPAGARALWPLMEVCNSSWLASYRDRLWRPSLRYRHYRIVSDDGTFEALACSEPVVRWIAACRA